jgi:hypothetical protein
LRIKCLDCGFSEEVNLDLFVKILGGATAGFGFWAWTSFLFAGTGFAMAICIAIITGGAAMLAYKNEIIDWIVNEGHECDSCGNQRWTATSPEMENEINDQESYLSILIKSSEIITTPSPMGITRIGLNLYRNKSGNVLILMGFLNEEVRIQYLNNYDVITEEELFLRFETGCVGPLSIDHMLESFDKYNDKKVSGDISNFLESLKASKIIICYSDLYCGASAAVVAMLYKILKKHKSFFPVIIKPASFKGRNSLKKNFIDLLVYLGISNYLVYDESLCLIKLGATTTLNQFDNSCEAELLEIASLIMKQ